MFKINNNVYILNFEQENAGWECKGKASKLPYSKTTIKNILLVDLEQVFFHWEVNKKLAGAMIHLK